MILWNRIKNIWAWSAYHPSGNKPKDVGFTWTDWKKGVNIVEEKPRMAQIIKREDPIGDFLKKTNE